MKKQTNNYRKIGLKKSLNKDIYVRLIELRWRKLFSAIFLFYLFVNGLFALVYFQDIENLTHAKTFWEAYYFSTQTMAAIGYGVIHPEGEFLNWVVVFQSAFSLISIAAITGIVFAKISKPHAKIMFSDKIIISSFNNQKCLSLRIANIRGNNIVEAKVRLSILANEVTTEGYKLRRVKDLELTRKQTPFFRLSWTVFHVINEESPLYNLDIEKSNIHTISATITGHDESYSSTIYARKDYDVEDIHENRYFEDIMLEDGEGNLTIDYSRFHLFKDIS